MPQPCTPAFIAALDARLPGVLRAAQPADLEEPRGRWIGQGSHVAAPRSTQEMSQVVRACYEAGVAIVPKGGGTGLVGAQLMPEGPVPLLVSLERMTALRGIWPEENAITVEAGMILADVQAHALAADRLFPLALASEGSCRIGGNLSTNAGGLNVLRYGNTRELCLGIEAVLPDGTIFNGLKRLRKDNTGYDLRHLLIGAEGSLGIITAASLKLYPRPASEVVALVAVESPAAALSLLALAESRLSGMISAFELIHRQGYDFLAETVPDVTVPFDNLPEWSVLIELGLPAGIAPEEAMASLYGEAEDKGLVQDGVIATSAAQAAGLWRIRESIPTANRRVGAVSSHDISLPLSAITDFIPRAKAALAELGEWRINCFGHLGDGNLHFNVFPPKGVSNKTLKHRSAEIQRCVHDIVMDMDGSFSAEHGVGRLKAEDLERYGDAGKLLAMRAIKAALDPKGIMNPGAMLK